MFKTFSEFLVEAKNSSPSGNYVSIKTKLEQGDVDLRGGVFTKSPHVTLMYSPDTQIEFSKIDKVLEKYDQPITAKFSGISIFGDGDSEGDSAVVLRLESEKLHEIHKELQKLGLKHTYDFEPHLTFAYKLNKEAAEELKNDLEGKFNGKEFTLKIFTNEYIDKEWVSSE